MDPPTFADIEAAHRRIQRHIHRTPVLGSRRLDALLGGRILFKCENFQRAGAFKARGAFNAVLTLDPARAGAGVATHSSGNHAAALALAAREAGVPAHVVMPTTAPAAKRAAVAAHGARITDCAPTLAAREAAAAAVVAASGATLVPPYDSPVVIAGQGTAAVELLADAGQRLDALLVPVGGGGLLGGTVIAAAALAPGLPVIACEPAAADDAARGFATGQLQPQVLPVATIADGLTTAMSPLTFGLMRCHAADVLTVAEAAIVEAMRLVFEALKIVIEPSAAVPVAALLDGAFRAGGRTVGVILTGGNVDLDRLPWQGRQAA